MTQPLLSDDSPLRNPPPSFSKRQILILDGLRYSAEMAHVSYKRLRNTLSQIEASDSQVTFSQNAAALQDAWSIVDSANRFRDFLPHLPGVRKDQWFRLFMQRTRDADTLRNCVQHLQGEIEKLLSGSGQLWGYLSWAGSSDDRPNGKWHMLSGGTTFAGDVFVFGGPTKLPFTVPTDRVRLNAYGLEVYLWRMVAAVAVAVRRIEQEIRSGLMKPVGSPAETRRGADDVFVGFIEVAVPTAVLDGAV